MSNDNPISEIVIRDAKFYFKNFSGAPGTYNDPGDRNFGVYIGEELAEELADAGWNVKYTKPKEDREPRPFLKIKLKFKGHPHLYMVRGNKTVELDEETVNELDELYFEKADIKLKRVYLSKYDTYGQYIDKGFFTILLDELDREYLDHSTPAFGDEDDIPF